ncbi:3-carboxy-cis,cis-muconate cycloisomerase [Streptomonospora sp. S1-112]|uniref:3-carboxy-cis,cis-muconate cycloisomerase n=1 Tax=Streptomonospora mangrovi TaxID=2883123 RepID=A0A9X3NP45_9ACTN|nr:3-carboxy-cis,cis-muconate cycloisomerase [Streptomonospora mangrovi]MDA0564080.1 3-carboxy-cis,cis-muconate cycloisomerase [Streptomonospora mangrovi]
MFGGVFAAGPAAEETGDRAWLRALLDAEAALARAHARIGLVAPEHAEAITAACDPDRFDAAALGAAATGAGNPVVPLVAELTRAVGGEAARHIHQGATSQDIMDTAAMLVARRAGAAISADAAAAAESLAGLAAAHRDTVMAGRTLLQQALPTTFGLVAATWLTGLEESVAALEHVLAHRAAAQLGGAAGTLASLRGDGLAVVAAFAAETGLAEPDLPWHTERGRIAELAGALARVCGAVAKPAGDIALLAQTEVGEVVEAGGPGTGGSSTLPHKRNPIAAVQAAACARRAPGLAATLLGAQDQQHQRAAGAWHAEWPALSDLLRTTGSAVAWLRTSLERLEVRPEAMRANLAASGGFPLAERVTTDLAGELGRGQAHALVADACAEAARAGRPLEEVLAERLAGRRDRARIAALLDPAGYLGSAAPLIDRALAAHRRRAAERAARPPAATTPRRDEAR